MRDTPIYIIGCGAIGFPLAAFLSKLGRKVVAVRSSVSVSKTQQHNITISQNGTVTVTPVCVTSLDSLENPHGIFVVTAKSTANQFLATKLREVGAKGPIVVMQNGLDVEAPFIEQGFEEVFRTVLYFTSETKEAFTYSVKPVKASMIGLVIGTEKALEETVELLQNPVLTLESTESIGLYAWQKTIANVVFNSICPLLNQDNGIFYRDDKAMALGDELIHECIQVARADGIELQHEAVRTQVLGISRASSGLLISTLQDLNAGRPTEINYINLAVARKAKIHGLSHVVPKTTMLGHLILLKETALIQST